MARCESLYIEAVVALTGFDDILSGLSAVDMVIISFSYQIGLFVLVRMAGGGFTLGEVGLVAQAATIMLVEAINLTKYRVCCPLYALTFAHRFPSSLFRTSHNTSKHSVHPRLFSFFNLLSSQAPFFSASFSPQFLFSLALSHRSLFAACPFYNNVKKKSSEEPWRWDFMLVPGLGFTS